MSISMKCQNEKYDFVDFSSRVEKRIKRFGSKKEYQRRPKHQGKFRSELCDDEEESIFQ